MRLIRVGEGTARVAADIRASLTALGRGDSTAGGIALVGVTPAGSADPFDAVLVMPYGIVIIAGVDLPGPALRLEAPLRGQWKADNWPLVGSGDAVNPATAALGAADDLARRLNTLTNMAIPVGLVLAVGPYVDNVVTVTPSTDAVRVVYPTPARLREAIGALTPDDGRPCSVEQARAVLRSIDPSVPIQPDEILAREGFATGVAYAHAAAAPAAHGHAAAAPPQASQPTAAPAAVPDEDDRPTTLLQLPLAAAQQQPEPPRRGPEFRLLPIAAVLLIVAGIITAIALAATGADGSPPERPSSDAPKLPTRFAIAGVEYTQVSAAAEGDCPSKTFGDVQASLQETPCTGMRLGSYLATVDGKRAAVSVAVVEFAEAKQAKRLKEVADTDGSGGAVDIATQRKQWPGDQPSFDNAAYRTAVSGSRVRLLQAGWIGEPSSPDDQTLDRIAETAFDVPLTD